ncbi:short-chain dehydrogenase [Lysobacter sp. Root916]|uniref:SDR family oxidoreductase n=1 Tax=Lysobacter sp. Root916 TaxID=1736606 RepID=UPI0007090498|nr:short-chain dehydrogenase [Lysobacter sp. Root916]
MALRDKTVLLTGASGGIGSALCDALVATGARVIAVGRNEPALAALAQRHEAGRVTPLAADLSSAEGRARVIDLARRLSPSPSVVILAHAQSAFGLFEDQSPARLEQLFDTNLVAPALLIHDLLPILKQHERATVAAIGSTFGSLAFPGFSAYSASKFGLRGLMEGLSREYADTNLRFQYLAPRATRTAFNSEAVNSLNRAMKVAQDEPAAVAAQIIVAIEQERPRMQLGWPEKLFARLNGAFPSLIDRNLKAQLPLIRRHARP